MRSIELNVNRRETEESPRGLRRGGVLPGVFYGAGTENVTVKVDALEFSRSGLSGRGAHLIKFRSSDAALDQRLALVHAMQLHPVEGTPLHVDFLRVDENKAVTARVTLAFVGKAKGIVDGGIVQPIRRDLEVRALPINLPEQIEVDVTALGIHDSIHVEDLPLPEGVEILHAENFTIVTVVSPTVEGKGEAPGEAAVAEVAEAAPATT
ncbi:MAG: 50S ribosomal protein L25 [Deltaproteobacteria bacterium]|nr:50S ribosomal protein L25 [Deltaproteobacteria bacterium]